jgi:hypothetical protein
MPFDGNEDHRIKFEDAAALTKAYRDNSPASAPKGGFFGRAAIEQILSQNGCMGIRYYHGQDASGKAVIVLVGTDANEDDQVDVTSGHVCREMAIPCPNRCGVNNILNNG